MLQIAQDEMFFDIAQIINMYTGQFFSQTQNFPLLILRSN